MAKIPEGMQHLEVSLRSKMQEVTSDLGLLLSAMGVHLGNAIDHITKLEHERDEAVRERDELKEKLAEAENLLRTDSHGDIRSVFEMEGRAEKAEAERDELKGQLARAETRERDLEVVNSRVEADYAALLEKGRALFQYGHLLETVVGDVGEFAAALAANPAGAALLEIVKAAEGLEAWSSGAPDAFHRLNEHIDAICEAVRRKRGE